MGENRGERVRGEAGEERGDENKGRGGGRVDEVRG